MRPVCPSRNFLVLRKTRSRIKKNECMFSPCQDHSIWNFWTRFITWNDVETGLKHLLRRCDGLRCNQSRARLKSTEQHLMFVLSSWVLLTLTAILGCHPEWCSKVCRCRYRDIREESVTRSDDVQRYSTQPFTLAILRNTQDQGRESRTCGHGVANNEK